MACMKSMGNPTLSSLAPLKKRKESNASSEMTILSHNRDKIMKFDVYYLRQGGSVQQHFDCPCFTCLPQALVFDWGCGKQRALDTMV